MLHLTKADSVIGMDEFDSYGSTCVEHVAFPHMSTPDNAST